MYIARKVSFGLQSNVTYPDATYPSTSNIRQWGVLNNFDSLTYNTWSCLVVPLIAHTRYGTCTWITRSRRIYDVMRHAYNKVAFYPVHKTCSTVKLCKYIPAVLYVIILHKNIMVSVIRHIQLSNMGLVPKWSDKWHSTVSEQFRLSEQPIKPLCPKVFR